MLGSVVEYLGVWKNGGMWWRWRSVGEYERDKKKSVLLFCTLLYIYNFLASYGSLEDDDPNRYLIDLST